MATHGAADRSPHRSRVAERFDARAQTDCSDGPPLALASLAIDELDAVLDVNRRFYEAFESRNMDAMSDLWERSPRAMCTHPGWATLRGWGPIAASFFALFQNGHLQFLLTEERAEVVGDTAWVAVDENLLGDHGGTTISAVNIFVRPGGEGAWRLVCHHGSIVNQAMNVSG